MDIYSFLESSFFEENKEKLIKIVSVLDTCKNYGERTWESKNKDIYDQVKEIAENLNMTWKETKLFLPKVLEVYNSPSHQKYIRLKTDPSFENCVELLKDLKDSKTPNEKIQSRYPFFVETVEKVTDPLCNSFSERIYLISKNRKELNRCPYCGDAIHIVKPWETETCCKKECVYALTSKILGNLPEDVSKQILDKRRKTNLEKYGVDNPNKCKEVRDKIEKTSLERYGVRYTTQSEEAKEKKRKTFLEKYGTEVASKADVVKEKARKTFMEKYGVDNVRKSQWIRDYYMEKYGVDDSNLIGKDLEKIKIVKDPLLFKEYLISHASLTIPQMSQDLGFSSYFIEQIIHKYELEELANIKTACSNGEFSLQQYIRELLPDEEIIFHDRTQIYPYELDIYIPERKIALEYNGDFWHSDYVDSEREPSNAKTRHLFKTNRCKEKGIRLIHIFEHEWLDFDKNIKLKKFIRDNLCDNTKIFARKCEVREIDSRLANEFFGKNHLQGSTNAKINFGLFYEGELVSCMSFSKPRFSSKHDWEIMRFVSKEGISVTGGAAKLLDAFVKKYKGSIITYSDIAKMSGNIYRSLGFIELKPSKPGYVWVKNAQALTRYKTQKHKLLKEGYVGNTEDDIMRGRGFYKLYDCGNYVFELKEK